MKHRLLIGTYTQDLPHVAGRAKGLLSATFDGTSVGEVAVAAPLTNPSWVTASPDRRWAYAVEETGPDGSITAFAVTEEGDVRPFGRESAGGDSPAHIVVHPSGRFLLTGTYGSGTVSVWTLDDDGMPQQLTAFLQHEGRGPDPDRQEGPHVHQLVVDPVTGDIVVVDLGLGEVRWYALSDDGMLTPRPEATVVTGEAGPRHLAFHPNGLHAFLVNELDSTLDVLRREGERFERVASVSTRAPGASGPNLAAAVRVTEDGDSVLVTNRGDDTLSVFAFDREASALTLATFAAAGRTPRDLVLSPEGDRVLVACQDSDAIAVFAFDPERRSLELVATSPAPTPVCILFL